jgi:hypothetical protein
LRAIRYRALSHAWTFRPKLDISKDKKAEAAAKVHKALAGKAWLPEVLRFAS